MRADVDEGVAAAADGLGERQQRVLDLVRVVPVSLFHLDDGEKIFRREVSELASDVDGGDPIALALFEGEGDDEAAAVRHELGDGRNDAEVDIAVGEVEPAEQLTVERQPVGIVGVRAGGEAIPRVLDGLDLVAERAVAEARVADEVDHLDFRDRPLVDLEHEVDPVLRKLDDLGLDAHGEAAAAPVDLGQPLQVRLHPRPGVDHARLKLDLGFELVVRDIVVTLEGHAIDDRVLHHADDERVSFPPNGHVGEEARIEQALEGLVDRIGIVVVARPDRHVGPHGFRLDTLVALHEHGLDHAVLCRRGTDPHAEDDHCQPDDVSHSAPSPCRCRSGHPRRQPAHEVRPMMSFVVTHTIKAITSVSPTVAPIC